MAESKPSAYVETTVLSYLTAWPSRDLVRAGHQQITKDWWRTARDRYSLVVSEVVHNEIAAGDVIAAKERQAEAEGIPILAVNEQIIALAQEYHRVLPLPPEAAIDAIHIACTVVYEIDYLVTWNCRHIANAARRDLIGRTCLAAGCASPLICTPEELMED